MLDNKLGYELNDGFYKKIINGIEVSISDSSNVDASIILANKIVELYPSYIKVISDMISNDEWIINWYGNFTSDEVIKKLNEPKFLIWEKGGLLTYCNHEFDDVHLLDIEFGGAFEKFYSIGMDG